MPSSCCNGRAYQLLLLTPHSRFLLFDSTQRIISESDSQTSECSLAVLTKGAMLPKTDSRGSGYSSTPESQQKKTRSVSRGSLQMPCHLHTMCTEFIRNTTPSRGFSRPHTLPTKFPSFELLEGLLPFRKSPRTCLPRKAGTQWRSHLPSFASDR